MFQYEIPISCTIATYVLIWKDALLVGGLLILLFWWRFAILLFYRKLRVLLLLSFTIFLPSFWQNNFYNHDFALSNVLQDKTKQILNTFYRLLTKNQLL